MKTLDEVIDELEDEGLFADALHYLKEYQDSKATIAEAMERYTQATLWHMDETEKLAVQSFVMEYDNPPLTWDELRQMKRKPVWLEETEGKGWVIITGFSEDVMYGCIPGGMVFYEIKEIGTEWNAYRKEKE